MEERGTLTNQKQYVKYTAKTILLLWLIEILSKNPNFIQKNIHLSYKTETAFYFSLLAGHKDPETLVGFSDSLGPDFGLK